MHEKYINEGGEDVKLEGKDFAMEKLGKLTMNLLQASTDEDKEKIQEEINILEKELETL